MFTDMKDWEQFFADLAFGEGWQIIEVGPIGAEVLLVESVFSQNDDDAVSKMKESYRRCNPHAITAYDLLRRKSPDEFRFWSMETW